MASITTERVFGQWPKSAGWLLAKSSGVGPFARRHPRRGVGMPTWKDNSYAMPNGRHVSHCRNVPPASRKPLVDE